MRFKYYLWFAIGWFTFMIVLDGIYIAMHGPGRTGPLANAILSAIMGGFVMGILAIQIVLISRFHRPWFQVPETFAAPFLGGIIGGGIFACATFPHPAGAFVIFILPIFSLWTGTALVSAILKRDSNKEPNQ